MLRAFPTCVPPVGIAEVHQCTLEFYRPPHCSTGTSQTPCEHCRELAAEYCAILVIQSHLVTLRKFLQYPHRARFQSCKLLAAPRVVSECAMFSSSLRFLIKSTIAISCSCCTIASRASIVSSGALIVAQRRYSIGECMRHDSIVTGIYRSVGRPRNSSSVVRGRGGHASRYSCLGGCFDQ
jgi:hypothetical protein